jgi:hypothetical protein
MKGQEDTTAGHDRGPGQRRAQQRQDWMEGQRAVAVGQDRRPRQKNRTEGDRTEPGTGGDDRRTSQDKRISES